MRALDIFDAVTLAKARGMRGFVFKTHQDAGSAGAAYLARKHAPGVEVFGRTASNYSTGGVNVDRKSTRLNSRHQIISYAVFFLKKKKTKNRKRWYEIGSIDC